MSDEPQFTQNSKSVQIILKIQESFLKRFDKTISELGYSRTEAIREAMRRFQQEGEKKIMERPETVIAQISAIQTNNNKMIFDELKKIGEERQRKVIWMPTAKPEIKDLRPKEKDHSESKELPST